MTLFLWIVLGFALITIAVQLWTGVPPYPASRREVARAVSLLQESIQADGVIYELGSGWGNLLFALGRAFPERQVIGYEISPLPMLVSWIRSLWHPNVTVRWGDFYKAELEDAAAVTAYLMIEPMIPLAEKLDKGLRPGTLVLAIAFLFRGRKPLSTLEQDGVWNAAIALYKWPAIASKKDPA